MVLEIYGKVCQAKEENIIQRIRIVCRKSKATGTHSEYAIKPFLLSYGKNGQA
jgi:hypothetical protein